MNVLVAAINATCMQTALTLLADINVRARKDILEMDARVQVQSCNRC